MNFKELTHKYLNSPEFVALEPNSQKSYRIWLKKVENQASRCEVGSDRLRESSRWFKVLSELQVSGSTKNTYMAILKIVYNWGEEQGFLDRNPIAKMKRFRSNPDKQPAYTQEEIERIWEVACSQNHAIYANFIKALFYSGCRPQELIDLCQNDVAPDFISIRSAKHREKGKVSRKCNMIKELRECITWSMNNIKNTNPEHEVFQSPMGYKLQIVEIRRYCVALCQMAGIEYKQLRNCRSGLATAMDKAGYGIRDIQATLGHKSVATTERYFRPSMEENASRFKGLCPSRNGLS